MCRIKSAEEQFSEDCCRMKFHFFHLSANVRIKRKNDFISTQKYFYIYLFGLVKKSGPFFAVLYSFTDLKKPIKKRLTSKC